MYMLINLIVTGKIIKKILRLTVMIVVILLMTLFTLFSVLRTPTFQELAGRMAARYMSEKLHTDILLDKLRITDFLFLELEGLKIDDIHGKEMMRVGELKVKLDDFWLSRHRVGFERVSINNAGFFLEQYPGDSLLNFDYFLHGFQTASADTTSTSPAVWRIYCNEFSASNLSFGYRADTINDQAEGIDFENLVFSDIFMDIKDITVTGDSIAAFVDHLACKESSGLELLNFSGDARVSNSGIRVKGTQISTGQSSLDLDLEMLYNDYGNLSEFLDSVGIHAIIRSSLLTPGDVGYFAPELLKMDDPVMISGFADGKVSDFTARDFNISLGEFTEFNGDISIKGLPDFNTAYISLDIKKLNTTPEDISEFNLPLENPNIVLPPQIIQLGFTSMTGKYEGYPDNFKADLDIRSDAGNLKINGSLSGNKNDDKLMFAGDIVGTGIQLGSLLISEDLGTVDLDLEFEGSGNTFGNLDLAINGWIQDLEYKTYRYEKIIIGGRVLGRSFDGRLVVLDPNLHLGFKGLVDFNGNVPAFDFKLELDKARFYKLNLADRSEDMDLKGQISIDIKGKDPESFYGKISIDSLLYTENTVKYRLDHLDLSRKSFPGEPDSVRLRSDYIDGDIEGRFVMNNLVRQITGFLIGGENKLKAREEMHTNPQYVSFQFNLKDLSPFTTLFLPDIEITPGTKLSGRFDSDKEMMEADAVIGEVNAGGIRMMGVNLSGKTSADEFKVGVGIEKILMRENDDGSQIGLDNFAIDLIAGGDSIIYRIHWDNGLPDTPNKGFLDGFVRFTSWNDLQAAIYNAEAVFGVNTWNLKGDNLFTIDSSGIGIKNFNVFKGEENLVIDGKLSAIPEDTLSVYFSKWSLANFNPFVKGMSLELAGIINGRFGLFRNQDVNNIFAGITIDDFSFNEVYFGNAEFNTRWLETSKALAVDLNIFSEGSLEKSYKILGINGLYHPFDESDNFDFDITAQNLNISVLEPLISSFSSHTSGFATGRLTLEGTGEKPLLLGRLKLQRAEMQVDYLNVIYSFSNEVVFKEDGIQFNELTVYDPNSSTAVLSGGIKYRYFQDMHLDLTIKPENFMVMNLNRYQNEVFYGQAFATGIVKLTGPFNNLSIMVDVKTEKNTKVSIPINYSVDVSQNDFIVFTGENDSVDSAGNHEVQIEGVSVDINMNVTKDADIEIFLPGNIGNIRAKGDGKLRLGVDPNGYLTLNGSYKIHSGLFVFSLEQLVSRRFDILEGSSISWTGDIYDAEVNIVARYRLRTSLEGLGISMIDPDAASQKVIVFTDIRMSGNLFNPDLTFGITFPNMQEQTKQTVYAVLDTNDQGLMNQQAISLLVLGSFSSTGSGGTNPVNPAAIVSSTLSNMLSQISNDFNIGINYMPGDQVSDEQLEVALSTQLLDDRLIIDGNIDVYGANASTQKTSSIVGDINVEYKLTPDGRFRVKAFNRSNDLSLFNDYAPYTQGVGIFYRKDFNNLGELFRKSGSNKQKKTRN
jgi:hypothetical protein